MNKETKRLEELTDKDGNFKSKYPGGPEKGYSLGYLEELCEWLYVHDDLTNDEKLLLKQKQWTKALLSLSLASKQK